MKIVIKISKEDYAKNCRWLSKYRNFRDLAEKALREELTNIEIDKMGYNNVNLSNISFEIERTLKNV